MCSTDSFFFLSKDSKTIRKKSSGELKRYFNVGVAQAASSETSFEKNSLHPRKSSLDSYYFYLRFNWISWILDSPHFKGFCTLLQAEQCLRVVSFFKSFGNGVGGSGGGGKGSFAYPPYGRTVPKNESRLKWFGKKLCSWKYHSIKKN